MRALLCAFLVACGGVAPAVVTVAPLPSAREALAADSYGDCRIEGTGDRVRYDGNEVPFEIFSTRRARDVLFLVTEPSETHVAWSQFPSATQDGRARAELGGQKHIRYAGYASLRGRTFSLMKRFAAEPGHLWARAGAPVEMIAFEGGSIIARVDTPFASPKTLAVRGACDAIAYVPSEPTVAAEKDFASIGRAYSVSETVHLYASPSGTPLTALTLQPNSNLDFAVIEKTRELTRVRATVDDIEIDAWVPSSEIDENAAGTMSGLGMSGTSSCGGGWSERGKIASDSPLFVGTKPSIVADAFVENEAEVYFDSADEVEVGGRMLVPFTFVDGMIAAANDSRMWVAKSAIQ